jgi:hypothetical protein
MTSAAHSPSLLQSADDALCVGCAQNATVEFTLTLHRINRLSLRPAVFPNVDNIASCPALIVALFPRP